MGMHGTAFHEKTACMCAGHGGWLAFGINAKAMHRHILILNGRNYYLDKVNLTQ